MSRSMNHVVGIMGTAIIGAAAAVLLTVGPVPATSRVSAQAFDAKATYLDKCAVCHAKDGAAKTAKGRKLKVKDIRETIKKQSEDEMFKIAKEGKGADMDAFGKTFNDAEIRALVTYYRRLASEPPAK